jgi:hypothetical protein
MCSMLASLCCLCVKQTNNEHSSYICFMQRKLLIPFLFFVFISLLSCKSKKDEEETTNTPTTNTNPPTIDSATSVKGFNLLTKITGIWGGPVSSSTALGNFPEWIQDIRPISAAQVSGKSELDSLNDIFLSFFIVYHTGEYKLAFRNGGFFAGMKRISYLGIDSVNENNLQSFYRFSDYKKGTSRTYTEIIFRNDSMYFKTYTNKSNTLTTAVMHMYWTAKRVDTASCQAAITNFSFPKKQLVKDFSSTFGSVSESIFYADAGDPYKETDQPYLGKTILNYTFASGITPTSSNKVLAMITTQPLISGFTFQTQNMKYRSRYVVLSPADLSFTFNYMHPGSYYYYLLYDTNGDLAPSSGDYISINGTNSFSLTVSSTQTINGQINFQIP